MVVDKAALLKPRSNVRDVEVEGVGTVKVRGLTRAEVLEVQSLAGAATDPAALLAFEAKVIAWALVEPKLTEDEARAWIEASPAGEVEPVAQAIKALSGLEGRADKEAFRGVSD